MAGTVVFTTVPARCGGNVLLMLSVVISETRVLSKIGFPQAHRGTSEDAAARTGRRFSMDGGDHCTPTQFDRISGGVYDSKTQPVS